MKGDTVSGRVDRGSMRGLIKGGLINAEKGSPSYKDVVSGRKSHAVGVSRYPSVGISTSVEP